MPHKPIYTNRTRHLLTGLLWALSAPLLAQDPGSEAPPMNTAADADGAGISGYFTFYLDNDLFSGADRDYTNGARASWISEGQPLFGVLPARRQLEKLAGADGDYGLVKKLSGFADDSVENQAIELNYGLSLTQLMFTPEDPYATTQPLGQRRYAGWLGLGFSVHARDAQALNTAELILGTTGPRSLAQQTQDFIHRVRDIDQFQGWDDQIPNEWTLDLAMVQKRRLRFLERDARGFSVDGFSEFGLRLGTFQTLARAGGFFRAGFNLPADFSDPRISSTAYSHKFFEDGQGQESDWSVYSLFGASAAGVAFDATLDGPLFKNFETGNTREPWVTEVFAGFGVRWKQLEFSYVQTWRSETYKEQVGNSDFGSIALRLKL